MTSEEPAVRKGVCKWNSQSKKLTERARHLSWRLHSLKARTFWMHFKNMGVYKHQHCKTYDAEAGARCHPHIFAVILLTLLLNLIVEGFIELGPLTLGNLGSQRNMFSLNNGLSPRAPSSRHYWVLFVILHRTGR